MYKNVIAGARRSGKTTALTRLIASTATEPDQTILVHGYVNGIYIRRCLILELEKWNNPISKIANDTLYLENGTRIYFRNLGSHSYNGISLDLLAIDDADNLSEDHLSALTPCIKSNGSMITTVTVNV